MALANPNAIINERIAVFDDKPNSISANCGIIERSNPTIPPTKALTNTNKENCCQFSLSPNCIKFSFIELIYAWHKK